MLMRNHLFQGLKKFGYVFAKKCFKKFGYVFAKKCPGGTM
jgi:hypothetical protein